MQCARVCWQAPQLRRYDGGAWRQLPAILKAKLRPAAGLCQHGASPDDEQRAHILVTAFAEPTEYRSVACGECFGTNPSQAPKSRPLVKAATHTPLPKWVFEAKTIHRLLEVDPKETLALSRF